MDEGGPPGPQGSQCLAYCPPGPCSSPHVQSLWKNIAPLRKRPPDFPDPPLLEKRVTQESISEDVVSAGAPHLGLQ